LHNEEADFYNTWKAQLASQLGESKAEYAPPHQLRLWDHLELCQRQKCRTHTKDLEPGGRQMKT
jgi:hypothetical protein